MTHRKLSRRARGALALGLATGVLVPITWAGFATAAAPKVVCTSDKAGLADKLTKDITAALRDRSATTAISVRDRATNTVCTLRADQKFDSASVVKGTVLATLLWDAKKSERYLTQAETDLATAMITRSDNAATTKLWKQLGVTKVKAFLKAAKMTKTVPGADGYWGLTQITAGDEQKLLTLITTKNTVLSKNSRVYIRKLMSQVVASQRWGVSAGAPTDATVHLKNGWLPRDTHGWRVHSIGAFTGGDHKYSMAVLTHDNDTMDDGVATIEAVSRAIHKHLSPKADARIAPNRNPTETIPAAPKS